MHCEHCGAELAPGARYCGNCGNPVGGKTEPSRSLGERLQALVGRTRRERTVTVVVIASLLVAVAAFLLLDPAPDEAPDTPATRAADEQCLTTKRRIAEISTAAVRGERRRARFAAEVLVAVQEWRMQLPGDPLFFELDAALRDLVIELGTLSRVSRGGDEERVAAQAEKVDAATATIEQTLPAAGLEQCAAVAIVPVGEQGG